MLALTEINVYGIEWTELKKKKSLSGNKINEKRNHVFGISFPKDGFLVPILLYKCMLILPNFMEMSSTAI